MKRIILKPGEENRIQGGHPWVYENEAARILTGAGVPAELEPGETVDVESSRKRYLGRALANPHSRIIARIYSPSKTGIDKGFFKRRFREAFARRTCRDLSLDPARLVFAEADFLPGLIVDRFPGWPLEEAESRIPGRPLTVEAVRAALGPPASWLSVQFLTFGMDLRRAEILAALDEVLDRGLGLPAGVIEKSAVQVRQREGLPLREGILRGGFPAGGVLIFEKGLPFAARLEEGQKTGYFLDQRENRLAAAGYAGAAGPEARSGERRVLDVCAYTGGFGIHAARAALDRGLAVQVTAVDVSAAALKTAEKNAALNGVTGKITTVEADCFEFLRSAERAAETYDLIILDPPAFAKTRPIQETAVRGYKEINLRAMKLLAPGGVLVSCSCSQALDEGRFKRMIAEAAVDAGRRLVQLDFRFQAPDHPILLGYGESCYLKCGIYRAV
ncbi:MAG: class I SAM-dependent rRNA methyltransferase [Spirochaetaceae bacterium]|jgi:23S rRNA (cytosine1962-C5)-methyltransferase|nr:class I SAM-dependent rRNA methyltransferase [Spirochaetaceae bacterium]